MSFHLNFGPFILSHYMLAEEASVLGGHPNATSGQMWNARWNFLSLGIQMKERGRSVRKTECLDIPSAQLCAGTQGNVLWSTKYTYTHTHKYRHTHTHTCIHTHIYIHVYIHTHTHTLCTSNYIPHVPAHSRVAVIMKKLHIWAVDTKRQHWDIGASF